MNRYKVMLPLQVHTEDAAYKQGDIFEKDFSPEDEEANLSSGLLELQPNRYKVVGDSRVYDHGPGEEFEAAIPLAREKLLAGHLERVEAKPKRKAKEA